MLKQACDAVALPEQALGKPHPNSTTGSFSLIGSVETGMEQAIVRLFDLPSRAVTNAPAFYNEGAWQVADLQLPTGMYMYKFSIDAHTVHRGKIIINTLLH